MKIDEVVSDGFNEVDGERYHKSISYAQSSGKPGMNELTVYDVGTYNTAKCYLSNDNLSGYCVKSGNELVSVFSLAKGRGGAIVKSAINNGANNLDCFAEIDSEGNISGHLYSLYGKYGFKIDKNRNEDGEYPIKNGISKVEGEPRVVVYMRR